MNKTAHTTYATQENIADRATKLWEGYGRPTGRDTEIWLEAERQLLGVDQHVEGTGNVSVAANKFDEATRQDKPRTRLKKSAEPAPAAKAIPPAKPVQPAEPVKTVSKVSKSPSPPKQAATPARKPAAAPARAKR